MSAIAKVIEAFPLGRSNEELFLLCGAVFNSQKRIEILAELDVLQRGGVICKGRDGKWRPAAIQRSASGEKRVSFTESHPDHAMHAAPASFYQKSLDSVPADAIKTKLTAKPDEIVRYWRSALRSDPRGKITTRPDLHRVDWHMVVGQGPIINDGGTRIDVPLDGLGPEFRQALLRREAIDASLAIGWPISISKKSGMPVIRPIGLFSASWRREDGSLMVDIEDPDVLVNPDWLTGAARELGYSRAEMPLFFSSEEGNALDFPDFVQRLREVAAGHIVGRLSGELPKASIDPSVSGIHNAVALFLPGESSFTAGASADLDKIAGWSKEDLSRTALAPLLGLDWRQESSAPIAINLGPLNLEQLRAVRSACNEPLSLVQGPPGTGKSQAIVSIAASILKAGGSVLVASKNHQALDAVEERLGSIAPGTPFLVRTLDPNKEVDVSFDDVLKMLVTSDGSHCPTVDHGGEGQLKEAAAQRAEAILTMERRVWLETKLAELVERGISRKDARSHDAKHAGDSEQNAGSLSKLKAFVANLFNRKKGGTPQDDAPATDPAKKLAELRRERDALGEVGDPIVLGDEIALLAERLLREDMQRRVVLGEDERLALANHADIRELGGGHRVMPTEIAEAIVRHRPLWLASVLGAGKRIPLAPGLFDLVIFDEASQCDIASAMPLFARAKRAVVVGDDRQLSFIPQLGIAQDRNLMQAQGLDPAQMAGMAQSKRSLFDCVARVRGVPRVTLRHQYRSAGPIVEYISDSFYGGQLVVAQPPGVAVPKETKPGLAWTDVPAPMVAGHNNVNTAEVEAISKEVESLLVKQSYEGTIGAISPFRAQVQAIQEAVDKRVPGHLLATAEFKAATVDSFQGQERDLILFSPVLSATSPISAVTFVQKDKRRLNVAISRARAVAHVMGDLSFARSGKLRGLASLASYATEPRKRTAEGVFDSEWEARVYHALKARGLDPQPQYDVAGRRLDFALFGVSGVKLDLEVDGRQWHQTADGKRKSSDLWRDHQMQSLGWRVRRFWVDELSTNMEACLDLVEQDLS